MSGVSRLLPKPSPDYGSPTRRPADRYFQHRIEQGFYIRPLGQSLENIAKPAIEQQHGEAVNQTPGACDGRSLIERQRVFGNLLVAAGADRINQLGERGAGGL